MKSKFMYIYYAVFSILKPNTLDDNLGALTRYALLLLLLPSPSFFFFFFPVDERGRGFYVYMCACSCFWLGAYPRISPVYIHRHQGLGYILYISSHPFSLSLLSTILSFSLHIAWAKLHHGARLSRRLFFPPRVIIAEDSHFESSRRHEVIVRQCLSIWGSHICVVFSMFVRWIDVKWNLFFY